METKRPRVVGLDDLLELRRPLREKPAPLVYFSDREFARLIKGAVELPRRPRGPSVLIFDSWPSGGIVQGKCESPPGQTCFGQWTPAGPGRAGGVYFECICRPTVDSAPTLRCQVFLDAKGTLQCAGSCKGPAQCRLGFWKDRATRQVVLGCYCVTPALGVVRARARRSTRRR